MSVPSLLRAAQSGTGEARSRHAGARVVCRLRGVAAPALGTATAVAVGGDDTVATGALALGGFAAARMIVRPFQQHADQLALMRHARSALGALLVMGTLLASGIDFVMWAPAALALVLLATLVGAAAIEEPLRRARVRTRRIALVGPEPTAAALRDELRHAATSGYELAGRVSIGPADPPGHIPTLGALDALHEIVVDHHIDLIVLGPDIPRLPVFDRIAESCLELPVRLVDLNSFCERVFGHVPLGAINAAWFQYLMHPRFRRKSPPTKRVVDVVLAGVATVAFLPLMAIAALLVRLDGGPVLFTQPRIGEGGRPFRIFQLRTMRSDDTSSRWTREGDPRVTRVGKVLRRTHLDEVPQILNVLRGEMSIVGPRPEQPAYVAQLERDIPFYSRRHLIKPGITGWAQVRCGYAGSIEGSAWKMCHDLYYVKHRSFGLDVLILGETVRTLFADRQFPAGAASLPAFAKPRPARTESAVLST